MFFFSGLLCSIPQFEFLNKNHLQLFVLHGTLSNDPVQQHTIDCLGTRARFLDAYRVYVVRRVTWVDPCVVLLRFVCHQESHRSFHWHKPNINETKSIVSSILQERGKNCLGKLKIKEKISPLSKFYIFQGTTAMMHGNDGMNFIFKILLKY